jgi:signal transduction histidine kinase
MDTIDRVHLDCEELPAVWADHDRLEQVLVNLMDNAVRHNPPSATVVVTVRSAGPHAIAITVADDGIGLPEEIEDSVDGPTGRLGPTSGAGLGLSITRAIVAAHGGTLRLERPARGTRWHIGLPVAGAGADRDRERERVTMSATDG